MSIHFSRLYQLAKIYLFASSSGLYSCPLAMTDGACKSLKVTITLAFNPHVILMQLQFIDVKS